MSSKQIQRPASRSKLGRWLFLAALLPLPWAVSLAGTPATSAGHANPGEDFAGVVDGFALPGDDAAGADEGACDGESGLLLWWEEQMSEEPAGSPAATWWSDLVGRGSANVNAPDGSRCSERPRVR